MYSKQVLKHFRNPRNMGEMKNPDAVGEVGNPSCGDVLKLYLKIEKNKIKDIKFETLGCAAAIAVSSMVTEMAKGKTPDQAFKLTEKGVVKALGGLPDSKVHCSVLAVRALKKAIKDYRSRLTNKLS